MQGEAAVDVARYEGLVHSTAVRFSPYIEDDFDDVKQVLRIKVWRALLSYDATRDLRLASQDRYVFGCVTNQVKDLIKKRKRSDFEMGIEDAVPTIGSEEFSLLDSFELRVGLTTSHDQVYSIVEDEPVNLPSTLTGHEKRIVNLLLLDLQHIEVARALGMTKAEIARAIRTIRDKMADWKPTLEVRGSLPHRVAA